MTAAQTAADTAAHTVTEALESRISVRDFLPTAVPLEVIRRVLTTASRSPSGGNLQPWNIDVVAGTKLDELKAIMQRRMAEVAAGDKSEAPEYDIYPKELVSPHRDYRFKIGEDMYARSASRARTRPSGCSGSPATTSSSARRWPCSAASTGAWARRSGATWACSCRA